LEILNLLKSDLNDSEIYLKNSHLTPIPRIELGIDLNEIGITSCIDISDGLLLDSSRLADSSTVNINIKSSMLPISDHLKIIFPEEYKKFAEHLKDTEWNVGTGENICANKSDYKRADDINSLYEDENKDAPTNKENKWKEIFGSDRYLKCKSKKDIKNVKVFQICRWNHCDYKNESVYDDGLFIGRVQINMNDGKKRRFLYFTADYQLKK